jgi:hypothetical protein
MALRRRAVEPHERGTGILRHAIPVEQELPVQRLRPGLAIPGERAKKGRALPGIVRDARGRVDSGG